MSKNVGSADRIIRIIAGLLIIAWGFYAQSWWGVIGAVPLLTGILSYCPAYSIVGVNTCKTT